MRTAISKTRVPSLNQNRVRIVPRQLGERRDRLS
jgi:hypothetical protein